MNDTSLLAASVQKVQAAKKGVSLPKSGHNFPLVGKVAYTNDTILEKYVFRKN
jgi:hypothetical protein